MVGKGRRDRGDEFDNDVLFHPDVPKGHKRSLLRGLWFHLLSGVIGGSGSDGSCSSSGGKELFDQLCRCWSFLLG